MVEFCKKNPPVYIFKCQTGRFWWSRRENKSYSTRRRFKSQGPKIFIWVPCVRELTWLFWTWSVQVYRSCLLPVCFWIYVVAFHHKCQMFPMWGNSFDCVGPRVTIFPTKTLGVHWSFWLFWSENLSWNYVVAFEITSTKNLHFEFPVWGNLCNSAWPGVTIGLNPRYGIFPKEVRGVHIMFQPDRFGGSGVKIRANLRSLRIQPALIRSRYYLRNAKRDVRNSRPEILNWYHEHCHCKST